MARLKRKASLAITVSINGYNSRLSVKWGPLTDNLVSVYQSDSVIILSLGCSIDKMHEVRQNV